MGASGIALPVEEWRAIVFGLATEASGGIDFADLLDVLDAYENERKITLDELSREFYGVIGTPSPWHLAESSSPVRDSSYYALVSKLAKNATERLGGSLLRPLGDIGSGSMSGRAVPSQLLGLAALHAASRVISLGRDLVPPPKNLEADEGQITKEVAEEQPSPRYRMAETQAGAALLRRLGEAAPWQRRSQVCQ